MRYLPLVALTIAVNGCGNAHSKPAAPAADRAPAVGTGDRSGATYLLRYRGRTYVARQGAVPASLRPAVSTLRSIAEGAGRGGPVHEVRQTPS